MKSSSRSSGSRAVAKETASTKASRGDIGSTVVSQESLALIYSKLAVFDDKKSDEEFYKEISGELKEKIVSVDTFDEETAVSEFSNLYRTSGAAIGSNRMMTLHNAFAEKLRDLQSNEEALSAVISTCRGVYKERDFLTAECLRLQQDTDSLTKQSVEKSTECRDLQGRCKEVEMLALQLRVEEQKKTDELQVRCEESIANIMKQIQEEEVTLSQKEESNVDLAKKIVEFSNHLQARRDHLAALRKAKEIEKQLGEARRAQHAAMEEQRKLRVQTYQEREIKLRQTELELAEHLNMYQEKEGIFAKSIDDMSSISDQFLERVSSMEAELAKYQLEIEGSRDMLKSKNEKLERFQSHILALESKILEEVSDDSLETTSKSLQQRRAELVRELRDLQPPPPPPPPLPPAAAVPVSSEDPDVIAKSSSRRILGMSGLSTSSSSAAEEDSFPSPRNSCPPSSSSRTSREGGFGGMETVVGAETPISSPKPTMNSKRIGDEQYSPEEY